MIRTFALLLVFLLVALTATAQNKIRLYDDTSAMRKEVLGHIPAGTDIETAKKIMLKNKFKIIVFKMNNPDYSQGFLKNPGDWIFCKRSKRGGFLIEKAFAIGILLKDDKVIDVKNQLWFTGP